MFVDETLDHLELRKRILLAQSDVQRAMLRAECARLRPYLDHVDTATQVVKKTRPIWLAATPVLGLLMSRRWRKVATYLPTAVVVWKAFRKGLAIRRGFQKHSPSEEAASDRVGQD